MFNQLTYKQKTWAIVLASFTLFLFGYNISITKTFEIYHNIDTYNRKIETANNAPQKIKKLNHALNLLNHKVGVTAPSFELFQKEVLNAVVPFSKEHKIKINAIKTPHKAIENKYEVQTLQLECKSNFKKLTSLLDFMQQQNIGRVCSVQYELKKNNKTKKRELFATFFIQNYKAL